MMGGGCGMNYIRISRFSLVAIATLVIASFGFNGCTSGGGSHVTVPEFEGIGPPPIEVTVDQLISDYMSNEAAADSKYCEKRLLFAEVEVEEVFGRDYTDNHGQITYVQEYFMVGAIKFKLRDFGIMQNIEKGFVLNLVGECRGLLKGFVYIEDCWVESIVGDLGISDWEDIY